MERNTVTGVNGWLLVYLIGSVPLLTVYAMGLSGWFFEYPFVLMVAIFLVLAIPLVLVLLKSPRAPRWNIAVMWIAAVLMTLRVLNVFFFPVGNEGQPPLSREALPRVVATLTIMVGFCLAWAMVWTRYFKQSVRVRNTFGEETSRRR